MLAAYYPPSRRAQILSRWSVGALIGAAVGFLVAAPFASPGAWRLAFFFTGVPGLIFAFLIWRTREKMRHEDDPPAKPEVAGASSIMARVRSYLRIPTVRVLRDTRLRLLCPDWRYLLPTNLSEQYLWAPGQPLWQIWRRHRHNSRYLPTFGSQPGIGSDCWRRSGACGWHLRQSCRWRHLRSSG
jgi:MFS family permease